MADIRNSFYHLLSLHEHRHHFVVDRTSKTIEISNNFLYSFLGLFKNKNLRAKLQEKRFFLFFKGYFAHQTHGLALRTLLVASAESLNKLFVHAKNTRLHSIWTKHVSNKFQKTSAIPAIKVNALHIVIAVKCFTLFAT